VRVQEDSRRCSVFVGHGTSAENFSAGGTGFFICIPGAGLSGVYLVTAAHIARELADEPFAVRVNRKSGGAELIHIDGAQWRYHPDTSVDVALLEFDIPDWADFAALPTKEFLTQRHIEYFKVGPGDATFVIGLFFLHSGTKRNVPVVHTGKVSLMPTDEKLPVRKGGGSSEIEWVEAYLVEAGALKGASGSQVLVRPAFQFKTETFPESEKALGVADGREYLLGVWSANWEGEASEALATAVKMHQSFQVPVGMGMVVPAYRIQEILLLPEVRMSLNKRAIKDRDARAVPASKNSALGSTQAEPADGSNPLHREDFTRLLGAAAKSKRTSDRT
jgi:hypothetical protein